MILCIYACVCVCIYMSVYVYVCLDVCPHLSKCLCVLVPIHAMHLSNHKAFVDTSGWNDLPQQLLLELHFPSSFPFRKRLKTVLFVREGLG